MNIAFFGSALIAATILDHVHREHPVSLVVSQPDKPVGREQIPTPTAVSSWAIEHVIPYTTEASVEVIDKLLTQHAIDIAVVVAYGHIIKKQTLEIPRYGFINVHYSLLPKYRGASPVQFALLNGEHETGVTIMQMDEALDHGPILAREKVTISTEDTTISLLEKLTAVSIPLLTNALTGFTQHHPVTKTQDHSTASSTRRLTKQDGFIKIETLTKAVQNKPLEQHDIPDIIKEQQCNNVTIHNFIRALHPWPGVWTINKNGKRIKIISSLIDDGILRITRHQEEGKTPVRTPRDYFTT